MNAGKRIGRLNVQEDVLVIRLESFIGLQKGDQGRFTRPLRMKKKLTSIIIEGPMSSPGRDGDELHERKIEGICCSAPHLEL
jgi:hypothetical protein